MGIIIWLIVGGICGWLASLIMRTDAQQGIILNIVVGIVGAVIAGLLFGGGNMNNGITIESFLYSLLGAVILLAIVNLDPPGHRPLSATSVERQSKAARHPPRGLFLSGLLQLEGHRERDLELLLARHRSWCRPPARAPPSPSRHRRRRRIVRRFR